MALDGLVIHAIVHELQACIGGRISKIHQPSEHDIIIQLRTQGSNCKLLLSANPTYPRVHLTDQSYINPKEAPMFCMLLRKYCESGIIESIEQIGFERVIHMQIRHRDELGDVRVHKIVIELMGRHSNIILLDPASGNILDGIHHVTPAISSHRIVLPGSAYVAPPDQDKLHPLSITKEQFKASLSNGDQETEAELETDPLKPMEHRIVEHISGISPLVAREIIHCSKRHSKEMSSELDDSVERIWSSFQSIIDRIAQHRYEPKIVETASGKAFFSVVPLTHIDGTVVSFAAIGECLEAYYGDKAERDTVKQRVADLLRFLQNEKNKNIKKLEKLEDTIEEAKDANKHRVLGELLTASLHRAQRGDKQIEVIDYYDEEQKSIVIPLDSLLSPSENAQRYFKKYNKAKNSVAVVRKQIQSTWEEIEYIQTLLQQLNSASVSDIEEIREELIDQGYIRNRGKKTNKKKKNLKPVLSCFTSSEGIAIYVGKNNTQNEYLTNRLAQSADTWLHTKDIPGSHVVIRSTSFGEATLEEAAQLAAYFSQARESSSVPIDYTLIRHVRKPNGAKPGYVIYDHQKTLFVTPDEQLVKALKVSLK